MMRELRVSTLVSLAMFAFAANSLLNRVALSGELIGPAAFAAIRLLSGAALLASLVFFRAGRLRLSPIGRAVPTVALLAYAVGFSLAYTQLPAGLGALILFGFVQITMFGGAALAREGLPPGRWLGGGVAAVGLVWLLWPEGAVAPSPLHAAMMAAAGVGWGVYSLAGRGARLPIADTASNFALAAPVATALWFIVTPETSGITVYGAGLAVISGTVTSGLGYAIWYSVLPRISASTSALAQLTVPVIAVAGGVLLLDETLTLRMVAAGALVLTGVAIGIAAPRS